MIGGFFNKPVGRQYVAAFVDLDAYILDPKTSLDAATSTGQSEPDFSFPVGPRC
ncbi:hypothetical protein QTP88_024951 [Uroleucon formosanum]